MVHLYAANTPHHEKYTGTHKALQNAATNARVPASVPGIRGPPHVHVRQYVYGEVSA